MPHHTRHTKKTKKPKRTKPLGIEDPETLAIHRELQVLRIAGNAKPGKHREKLLDKRFRKLEENPKEVPALPPRSLAERILDLREKYERRAGR